MSVYAPFAVLAGAYVAAMVYMVWASSRDREPGIWFYVVFLAVCMVALVMAASIGAA